jgi:hypothetical protein
MTSTATSTSTSTDTPYLAALQSALAGEHAAVWACGRAAAELTGAQRTGALKELDAHRSARDELRRQVVALGAQPVPAAAAYVEPFEVAGRAGGRRLLAHVDSALVATYADLAAVSPLAGRRGAVAAATQWAVQALSWGADPAAFPGQP